MANEYGNYATLDPLNADALWTFSEGNKRCSVSGSAGGDNTRSTIFMSSGKWYWEILITSVGGGTAKDVEVGICLPSSVRSVADGNQGLGSNLVVGWSYHSENGKTYHNGTAATYGSAYGDGAVIGVALDLDAGAIYFSLDNAWQNSASEAEIEAGTTTNAAYTGLTDSYHAALGYSAAGARECDMTIRFDHASITGDAPSGFLALATQNLPEPAIINPDDHYYNVLLDHDGSSTATTCTFNLDTYEWLAIIKSTAEEKWYWINSVRGENEYISSNNDSVKTADSNVMSVSGTTLTLGSTLADANYLIEVHRAGLASATAANTDGTFAGDSSSSDTTHTTVNLTSGFGYSIFTGRTNNGIRTIGHGLDKAPEFVINKQLVGGSTNWASTHIGLTNGTKEVYLNLVADEDDNANHQNNTRPSATLLTYGSAGDVNGAGDTQLVMYWHSVAGYSDFGVYETNGSTDGPFLNTGFCPSSVFIKHIDEDGEWYQLYEAQNNGNPQDLYYSWSLDTAQPSAFTFFDWVSNGVKFRTAGGSVNDDGGTVIYGAWGGRPLTDRAVNQGRAK